MSSSTASNKQRKSGPSTSTLAPALTVFPGGSSSSSVMMMTQQQQGASLSTLPNVLRAIPCMQERNLQNASNNNENKKQILEKSSTSASSWGAAAAAPPTSQQQQNINNSSQTSTTSSSATTSHHHHGLLPGKVCETGQVGSLVDISGISSNSAASSITDNNNNTYEMIKANALKSAAQSDLMMGLQVHPDCAQPSINSEEQQEDADTNNNNSGAGKKLTDLTNTVKQTISKRKQILHTYAANAAASSKQRQQMADETVTLITAPKDNNRKQQQQEQQQTMPNKTKNAKNNNNKESSSSTSAAAAALPALAAAVVTNEDSIHDILHQQKNSNSNENLSVMIRQINDLLLRRIETESFSIRSSLDLETLSEVVKKSFVAAAAADDDVILGSHQLSLFCTIVDRLPHMFKCHTEIVAELQQDGAAASSDNNNNNTVTMTRSQIIERIIAKVFTQESFQVLLSAFSSICRLICKATSSEENLSLMTNSSSNSKQNKNSKNADETNNNKSSNTNTTTTASSSLRLGSSFMSTLQRSFMNSCFTFSYLLHEHNKSAQFLSDTDISILSDCCINATTAHAHRDVALFQSSEIINSWKELVFAPAVRLLHAIQVFSSFSSSNNNNNNNTNLAKVYLQALPKTSSTNSTSSMFSLSSSSSNSSGSKKSSSSSSSSLIHLSAVTTLALVTSMPLGVLTNNSDSENGNDSSSISHTLPSPQEVIQTCHACAREWASEIVDLLLKSNTKTSSNNNKDAAIIKEEKAAMFAISERFCDDLIQVLSSGTGSIMFPLWDCLVKEFSACLVKTILKNDEISVFVEGDQNNNTSVVEENNNSEDAAASTITTKTANVSTADKLRAHVVTILGKLAVAVGNSTNDTSSSSSSNRSTTQEDAAAAVAAPIINNNNVDVDDDDLPLIKSRPSYQQKKAAQQSHQAQLVEKSSKWLSGDQYTIPWKKYSQQSFEEEMEQNLAFANDLDFGGSNKNNKKKTSGRKGNKKGKRAIVDSSSSSSSDNDNNKDAATASKKKTSNSSSKIPKLSEFAFSDSCDNSTRLQFVRYHLLSELARENENSSYFFLSARQYFLARWAYRVEQQQHRMVEMMKNNNNKKQNNSTTATVNQQQQHLVPFKSLYCYNPASSSSKQQSSSSNNNNINATSSSSSTDFIRKNLNLVLAEDITFSKTQHPDSVLFPRNADMFMKLILNVFQRNSSSTQNNNNNNTGAVAGWDSARKSALKIVSKLLLQNPTLIATAWSLVRRSLQSPTPGVRAAVIPLLVNLLQIDEPDNEDDEDDEDENEEEQQEKNGSTATNNINSKNPVGFDDLLLESESFSLMMNSNNNNNNGENSNLIGSKKHNKEKTTTSMFTALVLACKDSSAQVQTPAVNALCDILETTASFGTLSTSRGGSSRKLFNLFQNESTLERFAISRLLESVLPSPSSAAKQNTTTTTAKGANNQQQQLEIGGTSKLFTRVCKMFSTRWLSPLLTSSSNNAANDDIDSLIHNNNNNSSSNSIFAESHMNGIKEEWAHLASFGLEPPFDDNWVSTVGVENSNNNNNSSSNDNSHHHQTGVDGGSGNNNNSNNNMSFRSVSIDDTKDLHLVHPLTLIMKTLLLMNSNTNSSAIATTSVLQRTIRFCLRPWLLDKTQDEEEEDNIYAKLSSNNNNNNENGDESGTIFAAIRRIGDAAPTRLINQSTNIFVDVLDRSINNHNNNDQTATQVIHSCDSLRAVIAEPNSNSVGVFDVDRVVSTLLAVLTKYSGSYTQKVIAACCRSLSAVLTVSDRVGNTRHIEKVFKVLNLLCSKTAQYSLGMKKQSLENPKGWSAAAPIIKTNILPVLMRYVYLISAIMRCHQNWASKDYPCLKNLPAEAVPQNILSSSSSSSSSLPTSTLLPDAVFRILSVVNDSIDSTLSVASSDENNSNNNNTGNTTATSSTMTESVITQLFRLRALVIRAFGSLCMLDASTYIRKCEAMLKSAILNFSNSSDNNNNNKNTDSITAHTVGVATQAVQAITDFLIDEELRIKSANADEKLHLTSTSSSNTNNNTIINDQHNNRDSSEKEGAHANNNSNKVTCNDSAVTFEDVMSGQKDQNSGLGPWILQQFWPMIQPLIGSAKASAALQVASLSFCRIASSQGLASPITFLPALIFGACHTSSFSAQDRSSSLDCIKVIFEHHEDTVAGQFAPAVIRCFDFIHQRNHSHSTINNNNKHQQPRTNEDKIAFFRDLAAFDVRGVYSLVQSRGKKRREAFLNVLGKMMTSTDHQETWLRTRVLAKQKARGTTSSKNNNEDHAGDDDEDHNDEASSSPSFDDDIIYSTGLSLCHMMMFCARTLFSLPLQDITEIQLLLQIFEQGFQQNMEISLAWTSNKKTQQQEEEDPFTFCRNLSRCVAALLCVETHHSTMSAFGMSKAKLEKWEAKQHQKEQTEVSFVATAGDSTTNNNVDAVVGGGTSRRGNNNNNASSSSTTKAEKAIGRIHNCKNSYGQLLDESFGEFLMGTAIRCIDPIVEILLMRSSGTGENNNKNKSAVDSSSSAKLLKLHQILDEKNDFMATTVLSTTFDSSVSGSNNNNKSGKNKKSTTAAAVKKATSTTKKKTAAKKKRNDDDDEVSTDDDDEDEETTDSSSNDSDDDDDTSDEDDDDEDESEEEEQQQPRRGQGRIAQARRRGRSTTPPPPAAVKKAPAPKKGASKTGKKK